MTPNAAKTTRPGVPETRKLPELEGLRGLLASWVVVTHILCWCGIADIAIPPGFRGIWATFIYAQPAVDVFIILSGFAIFHLLNEKPGSYRAFMTGRFFRIVPVYWVCLAFASTLGPVCSYIVTTCSWHDRLYLRWMEDILSSQRDFFGWQLAAHIPLTHGLVPRSVLKYAGDTFLSPAWSISLEWQFYLVAPLLSAVWRRRWIIVLVFAVGISSFWWAQDFVNEHAAFLPLKLHLFFLGAGCYFIERWLRSHHDRGVQYGPVVVILGIILVWVLKWQHWALTLWLICFSVSVGVWDKALPRLQRQLSGVLLRTPAQWLGRRSYSLYLIHWPMVIALLGVFLAIRPAASNRAALIAMVAIGLPAILLATALLHKWVEAPTLKLGRRLSRPEPVTPRL